MGPFEPPSVLYKTRKHTKMNFSASLEHFALELLGPLTALKTKAHTGVITS